GAEQQRERPFGARERRERVPADIERHRQRQARRVELGDGGEKRHAEHEPDPAAGDRCERGDGVIRFHAGFPFSSESVSTGSGPSFVESSPRWMAPAKRKLCAMRSAVAMMTAASASLKIRRAVMRN